MQVRTIYKLPVRFGHKDAIYPRFIGWHRVVVAVATATLTVQGFAAAIKQDFFLETLLSEHEKDWKKGFEALTAM